MTNPEPPQYQPQQPVVVQQPAPQPSVNVQMPAPQPYAPTAVTVSGPLDNLLKSLTADIAQDNLAIDALRTQVAPPPARSPAAAHFAGVFLPGRESAPFRGGAPSLSALSALSAADARSVYPPDTH